MLDFKTEFLKEKVLYLLAIILSLFLCVRVYKKHYFSRKEEEEAPVAAAHRRREDRRATRVRSRAVRRPARAGERRQGPEEAPLEFGFMAYK